MKKTYHVYPSNCYNSSRVLTQSSWDDISVFVHRTKGAKPTVSGFLSIHLSVLNLVKIVYCEKSLSNLVFHSQSSLIYLHIFRLLSLLLRKKNFNIIYDIHDLNELEPCIQYSTPYHYLRYGIIRHHILRFLENLCFQDRNVKVITVSSGLALVLSRTYKVNKMPTVVLNISSVVNSQLPSHQTFKYENAFLFFGQKERFPTDLVALINKSGIKLHIYGRGFSQKWIEENFPSDHACIEFFGPYSPEKLDFLYNYKVLLIYAPHYKSLNYKYSLPNKLFQALSHGLSVFVSSNFQEMLSMFEDIPGSVSPIEADNLISYFSDIISVRGEFYTHKIRQRLEQLYLESSVAYKNLML